MTHSLPNEALNNPPTPERECLNALLDLANRQEHPQQRYHHAFYEAHSGLAAPVDLSTSINVHPYGEGLEEAVPLIPVPENLVARAAVEFHDSTSVWALGQVHIDFVDDNGVLKASEWVRPSKQQQYSRSLEPAEITALQNDAEAISKEIIEANAERAKLGPLVEAPRADGTRRFHLGDVLSALTGRGLSARGGAGIVDISDYMADRNLQDGEDMYVQHGEQLGALVQQIEQHMTQHKILDEVTLYKMLGQMAQTLGVSMLELEPDK
ncbi:MAG TPA: hypothetical protein VFB59_00080 [Candidatus Saccharimonadales bacterium]|nr:hypothetical protein [Candidatus Saccharimonadales bacterium]